jgi:hypothetical protein
MRILVFSLLVSALAFGAETVVVDETFTTTFSDYGDLAGVLTCTPGLRGSYPTLEALMLRSSTVDLGFEIANKPFVAYSDDALQREGVRGGGAIVRPYDAGCKPALEKWRKKLEAFSTLEVKVHRKVVSYVSQNTRAFRSRDGRVDHAKTIETELRRETFRFELGGLKFSLDQMVNGPAREM